MENTTDNLEAGFKLNNLFLIESIFKREAQVTFDESKTNNSVSVDVTVNLNGNIVIVTEELNYSQKLADKIEVSAMIKMVGLFEKIGEPLIDMETFGNINGAAIIFPYIREHLTSLSAKAGLGLILLPPANFTKNKLPIKK
jgi:preprotein translocase subunit SecB